MNALIVTARNEFYDRCEGYFLNSYIPVQLSSFQEKEFKNKLEAMQPDILLLDAASGEEMALSALTHMRTVPLICEPGRGCLCAPRCARAPGRAAFCTRA